MPGDQIDVSADPADGLRFRLLRRVDTAGVWLLGAAFALVPLTTLRVAGGVTWGDLALVLALLAAFLALVLRRQLPVLPAWLLAGAGLLFVSMLLVEAFPPGDVSALLASFFEPAYGSSAGAGFRLVGALVVVPLAVSVFAVRWSVVHGLVTCFIAGVAVSCAVVLVDAYAGTGIQVSLSSSADQVSRFLAYLPARPVGLTGHPNTLGMTIAIASALVINRMTRPRCFAAYTAVAVLMLTALFLSGSRGGLVGFAFVVVASLALNRELRTTLFGGDRRVLAALALGAVALTLLTFVVPVQRSSAAFDFPPDPATQGDGAPGSAVSRFGPGDASTEASNEIRRQYYEDSVGYIVDRPLAGYGFEWIETSHNIYLQLLMSGGILALVGFLVVMAGYIRTATRLRESAPPGSTSDMLGIILALWVFLLVGLVATDLLDRYLYLVAGLALGMSAAARDDGSRAVQVHAGEGRGPAAPWPAPRDG